MYPEEREMMIVGMLNYQTSVSVKELAKRFDVSEVTIRKDLDRLEKSHLVRRTHGGAIASEIIKSPLLAGRQISNLDQKQRIGKAAAKLVQPGDKILLDSGTSADELAKNLNDISDIEVITNDIQVATSASTWLNAIVFLVGGYMKGGFPLFSASTTQCILSLTDVDKCFLSVDSVSIEGGLRIGVIGVLECKKAMMKAAKEVILLVDSSKFNSDRRGSWLADIADVDKIVTMNTLPQELVDSIRSLGIEVILVQ